MEQVRTFHILTFGCKVNQYETQALREAWIARCGVETETPAGADVIVLNTCAITANAVSEARRTVRRMRREYPDARIVVTGCAVEAVNADPAALPDADLLMPQQFKARLLDGLPGLLLRRGSFVVVGTDDSGSAFPPFEIGDFRRARPVLKVQDGCSHRCAYCIVPFTRGPSRSRSAAAALAEARRLLKAGFREIMISGINLRQYGCAEEGIRDFWDLIVLLERELASEWAGRARFRISSLEPGQLNDRGLDVLAASRLLCPHLHISLQSGSTEVLRQMHRGHYGPDRLCSAVERIRNFWPRFGLGADILTGFPGETEAQALETLDLLEALPFTYAHVFPFSARPGTPAAQRSDQISVSERRLRAERLRKAADRKRRNFFRTMLDQPVLYAAPEGDERCCGVNEYYVPCRWEAGPTNLSSRSLIPVRPLAVEPEGILVAPLDPEDR